MIQHDHEHENHDVECMICHLAAEVCDECGIEARDMLDEDEDAHVVSANVILVGCEGYHEPVFRYVYWAEMS